MPVQSPLHPVVFEKFRRAFGDANRVEGKDRHWALRPAAHLAAINVLVNGSVDFPVVWVFDPHAANDGVSHERILHEADVDALIKRIESRVAAAGRASRHDGDGRAHSGGDGDGRAAR